jgi:anti-sigma factor RsiW
MSRMHTDRLQELLADEALAALDAEHSAELETLLGDCPAAQRNALMVAALTQRGISAPGPVGTAADARRLKARLRRATPRSVTGPG